jgi:hypothetical protein
MKEMPDIILNDNLVAGYASFRNSTMFNCIDHRRYDMRAVSFPCIGPNLTVDYYHFHNCGFAGVLINGDSVKG